MSTIRSTLTAGVQALTPCDAKKALSVTVTKKHFKKAIQCDGKNCVIANAVMDSNVGEFCEGVEIGYTVTKIVVAGKIMRYATPAKLVPAIKHFDKHNVWKFEEGEYVFLPLRKDMQLGGRPNRWEKHREGTDGSGRDGKMRAIPMRRVSRLDIQTARKKKLV
jgi:hypothetical protein